MKARTQDNFFDVLIDRLIVDVRREFEASLRENRDETTPPTLEDSIFDEPAKPRPTPYDDLVAKMIGLRSRLQAERTQSKMPYQLSAPRKFEAQDIEIGTSLANAPQASRKRANPSFKTSAAQVAFELLWKSGARFFDEDTSHGALLPEALKRERRRVLLTLHPDRVPEADRKQAHHAFLAAAEAFSVLAEDALGSRAA